MVSRRNQAVVIMEGGFLERKHHILICSLVFGLIGFFGEILLEYWSISRLTNSTAAIGYIFLPFVGLIMSIPFAVFGYCSFYVYENFRIPKKDILLKYSLTLSISIILLVLFAYWLGNGLILCKLTDDLKTMKIEKVQSFLDESIYKKNKFALNAILSRKDIDSGILYKIASINSPELHKAMGTVFPIMGDNTRGLAVMRLVAGHPNVDARSLVLLANSPEEYVLGDVALNTKTPIYVIEKLFYEKDNRDIYMGLANNPNCPVEILQKLLLSKNEYIREDAQRNIDNR